MQEAINKQRVIRFIKMMHGQGYADMRILDMYLQALSYDEVCYHAKQIVHQSK